MQEIKVANRIIGTGKPCFIIAEAGVNHNGNIHLAKKLIDVAKDAGADAVKFQTFNTEKLVTRNAKKAGYQRALTNKSESQFQMLKKLELPPDAFDELFDYARKKKILFLSTPDDEDSVDLLVKIGVAAFKISSPEITNLPFLSYIAAKGKPVILSTGMSDLAEIKDALRVIRAEGLKQVVLLHCVSAYPAKIEDMNLRAMDTLRNTFKLPIGLSDHTLGLTAPIAAVAMGACIIEKHFTLDKSLPGPDHKASLEPRELTKMVEAIREIESALGDGIKLPTQEEIENKSVVRRSIVARIDIPKGVVIREDMLAFKRPGTGIEPKQLNSVVGRRAKLTIKKDTIITQDMV